jgi:DNA-binding response OmpR family regulator
VMSLEEDLHRQGYSTGVATDGAEAIARGRESQWDLILLDVMLPRVDGFEVCAALRRSGVSTPIILLTARTQEAEKILGLDSGADDYVTKPFSLRELRARPPWWLRRRPRSR